MEFQSKLLRSMFKRLLTIEIVLSFLRISQIAIFFAKGRTVNLKPKWSSVPPAMPALYILHFMTRISSWDVFWDTAMLKAPTTGFDNRPPVMSHTFPEQVPTAAVVAVQISMTDLACDVVLLWRSDQPVRLIATAPQPDCLLLPQWLHFPSLTLLMWLPHKKVLSLRHFIKHDDTWFMGWGVLPYINKSERWLYTLSSKLKPTKPKQSTCDSPYQQK